MACYYCPDCNYLYLRKRLNCPYCSSPLSLHTGPEEELYAKGYRVAPIDQKLAAEVNTTAGTADRWPDHVEGWGDDVPIRTSRTGGTTYNTGTVLKRQSAPQIDLPEEHNLFDDPDPSVHAGSIPGRRFDSRVPDHRSDAFPGSPRPIRANPFQFPDLYIDWRLIFRIVCGLFVVLSLIALWINRYVILNALFQFLVDLLLALSPLLILMFIVWYLCFRRP